MEPVLAAESIGKSFWGKRVLASAGLWAHAGRITALLGRNGSGKTTLMRIAVGWLRPDEGVVIFRGRRTVRPRLARMARRGLFYLPDRSLLSPHVAVIHHLRALERAFPKTEVEEAVALLGVSELLDRKPKRLSTGERRRVELALAVARRPACLVADEPFREIGPLDCKAVTAVLRQLADSGCAIVASGHETRELFAVADEVIWQTAGTTHHLGTAREALGHWQFRREYAGYGEILQERAPGR